jgi:glycosyltransferase involved in cell wall biosynthesis
MKIVLLNTYDRKGGAAVASNRLLVALTKMGLNVSMLVHEKTGDQPAVASLSNTYIQKKKAFLRFVIERLFFLRFEKSKKVRFAFSPAIIGADVRQNPLVNNADIIHLHWVNFGFLSLKNISQLLKLGKPVIWTLHDMWAFTGGCHYSGTCPHYMVTCGNCPFLRNPSPTDLSYRVHNIKSKIYKRETLTIVTCSNWLAERARESSLFRNFNIVTIPNPIDVDLFKPHQKEEARQKLNLQKTGVRYVLFGAASVTDERKGFKYLIEALSILKADQNYNDVELIVFGKAEESTLNALPYKVNYLGSIESQEKLVEIYSAADLLVLPSLEDNLPNTIMESLACGTPVVAFEIGGIPEMIDHQINGYLCSPRSAKGLTRGIKWVLSHQEPSRLHEASRSKVLKSYSEDVVANQYKSLYSKILKN